MPLDPSIILHAGQGVQPFDPVANSMKYMQAASMKQALESGQIEAQQKRQAMADDASVREAMKSSAGDNDVLGKELQSRGLYKQFNDWRKNNIEYQNKTADTAHKLAQAAKENGQVAKQRFDMANEVAQKVGALALGSETPQQFQTGLVQLGMQHPEAGILQQGPYAQPTLSPQFTKYLQGDWNEGRKQAVINAASFADAHKQAFGEDKDTGGAISNIKRDALGNVISVTPVAQKTATPGELMSAETARRGQDLTNRLGWANYGLHKREVDQKTMEGLEVGGNQSAQQYADALIQGRANWPKGRELTDPVKKAGWMLAMQQDPSLNENTHKLRSDAYKDTVTGKAGASLAATDAALLHLSNYVKNTGAIPDAGSKPLNYLWQPFREATSNTASDALGKAATDVTTLSDELESAYRAGGGTEKGIEYFRGMLDPKLPESTRRSNAKEITELLMGRRNETVNRVNRAFPKGRGLDLPMSEEASSALDRIQGKGKEPDAPTGAWSPKAPAGNPDTSTLGTNPRFPKAVWVGAGAPDGGGWYIKSGGKIRRVE